MNGPIVYEWNPGSIPPPHYFELRVVIGADGAGTLECRPDYDFNAPPTWTWSFAVPSARLQQLDARIRAALRDAAGRPGPAGPAVGGAQESITVQLGGRATPVEPTTELVSAVRGAVGDDVWTELRRRRDEYVARASQESR